MFPKSVIRGTSRVCCFMIAVGLAFAAFMVLPIMGVVRADPGIEFTKTVGTDPAECAVTSILTMTPGGGDATYCYALVNTGTVTFTLHDLVDSELGAILSGFSLSVEPGDRVWLTQTANITQRTVNTATWVAYNAGPTDLVSATDTALVEIAHPILDLDKTAMPPMVLPGELFTYTLAVRNRGTWTATNVIVSDTLPLSVTLVTSDVSAGAIDAGPPVSWSLPTLAPEAVVTLTMGVTMSLDFKPGDVVTNTAWLTSTDIPALLEDSVVVARGMPDFSMVKRVMPSVISPGDGVTYTLVFSNAGFDVATGILITDDVPSEILVSDVISSGVEITDIGPPDYVWRVADLPPQAMGYITITGIVSPSLSPAPGDAIVNTAVATSTELAAPLSRSASVFSPYADLLIEKEAGPEPVVAGRSLIYTVTVENRGPSIAPDVIISDTLSSGTSLHTLDQTDGNPWEFGEGDFGTATTWHDVRPWPVQSDDWLELSTPITSTGVFTSRVFDAYSVVDWTWLEWRPRRPYREALPDDGAAETLYELGNVNMVGNQVLLHMEALYSSEYPSGTVFLPPPGGTAILPYMGTLSDTSGLDIGVFCPATPLELCPSVVEDGRFDNALHFEGVLSQTVMISDTHDPARYALEMWVRPDIITDSTLIVRTDALTEEIRAGHYSHMLGIRDGKFVHYVNDGGPNVVLGTTDVQPGTWYHVVGTAQSYGDLKLYVNGREEGQQGGLGQLWAGGDHYRLGARVDAFGATYFSGDLDEVAVYSRTLATNEIVDHYLRGALALGFRVRSCDDEMCIGDDFVGPGGSTLTLYTAQDATLPSGDLPLRVSPLGLSDNRYFQYQATLMTEDLSYSPQLRWVGVGPSHRIVTATQGSCVAATRSFTCALGDLAPGQIVTVSTGAWTDSAAMGTLTNTAGVTTALDITATNNITEVVSAVIGEADLIVVKHDADWNDGTDPVNPSGLMTYTVLVRNAGPSVARHVTVTDFVPGMVVTATAPSGWDPCLVAMNWVTCTTASVYPTGYNWQQVYDWEEIVITAYAPPVTGLITNTVWVTSTTAETLLDATDNVTTENTLVTPIADVALEKLASTDLVDPGATLTYTLRVTNLGPYTATNVVVTDTLPQAISDPQLIAGTEWDCTWQPDDVAVCSLLSELAMGASVEFSITVTAPLTGLLGNSAVVMAEQYDSDLDNNWATIYTVVRAVSDLSIHKAGTPDPVDAADRITYTLTISNSGPAPSGVVTNTVRFGNGQRIMIPVLAGEATPYRTSASIYNVPGLIRNVTVTLHGVSHSFPGDIGALLVGPGGRNVVLMGNAGGGADADNLTLVFNDSGVSISEPLTDTVVYRPTNYGLSEGFAVPGPYGGSLSSFYGLSPNGAWRLYVIDTVYSDNGNIAGGWTLDITTVTTDTLTVTDTLHSGMIVLSPLHHPPGWICGGIGGGVLTCEGTYMDVGATEFFTLTSTAPITGSVIRNSAGITATTTDLDPDDNSTWITTTVRPVADLEVTKQVSPSHVYVGETFSYTVSVTNLGPSPLLSTTVMMTDRLPSDISINGIITNGWACDALARPILTCTVPNLLVGAGPELVVTATAPITPGVITNTAWVTATTVDADPLNNTDLLSVTVEVPQILISKTVVPEIDVPYRGEVTYTVLLSNTALIDVHDVHFTDTLPISVTFARWVSRPPGAILSLSPSEMITWSGVISANSTVPFTFVASHIGDYDDVVTNPAVFTNANYGIGDWHTATFTVTSNYSIVLTKTVGMDPAACATETEVWLPVGGGDAVFCYTVHNVGTASMTVHDLVDSELGALVTAYPFILDPGATTFVTTVTHITRTTVNSATWTAYDSEGTHSAQATAMATANVRAVSTLYLPLVMRNYVCGPDLIVQDLIATSTQVTVVIVNQGDAPVEVLPPNEFWVDLYIDPDEAPTMVNQTWAHVGDQGVAWGVTDDALPIAPGGYLTLTVGPDGGAYYWPEISNVTWPLPVGTELWVQVDSSNAATTYGGVQENHEVFGGPYNNILGPVLTVAGSHVAADIIFPVPDFEGAVGGDSHLPARP